MLTDLDRPEDAALTIECEICGLGLPVLVNVAMVPLERWASEEYISLEPDATDVAAHYLTHG